MTKFEVSMHRMMGWVFVVLGIATGVITGSAEAIIGVVLAFAGGRLTMQE